MLAYVLALLLTCVPASFAQDHLRIHFFDVGQGDAVLIQSPSGQNVVYDGGDQAGAMREHLQALGVSRIDLVIASHNHADHIGGLAEVLRQFRPRFYMDSGIPATTLAYRRMIEAVEGAGTELLEPTARRILLGEVSVVVLPPPGIAAWDHNNNSVGVVVEFGSFRLSLAGDAEPRQWAWWMERYSPQLGRVQVHKASHHGSRNGDTAAGIARLSPEVVVISAGRNNQYGHPDPETLRLYAEHGATVYRTDIHGTVLIEAESSGRYTVRVERGEGARPPTSSLVPPAALARQSSESPQGTCVDINNASADDLQRIIQIGPARAQQILELRRVQPFRSLNELTRVNGIAAARLRDIIAQGLACVR